MRRSTRSNGNTQGSTRQPRSLDRNEVARIAYELFERRGGVHGDDQRDWFEAERIAWEQQRRGAVS
ncbi:MAG: DUF2934 domain-containing protein [Candidatus Omnitrophica bacterium]|nr:DUF2934 domain-containing protein [Candidatus Omnitrophota bacterium]